MKKYIIFATLIFITMFSFAAEPKRFGDARRYIEFGVDAQAAFDNNYFTLGDFFQETLVIDLDLMAEEMSENGLSLSLGANVDLYGNFNFKNFGFGLFTNIEASGYSSIPKSIFEILSEGNTLGKTYSGDLNLRGDTTIETGAWFGTKIGTPIGKISFTFKPTYFIPVMHIHEPTTSYTVLSNTDGDFRASGTVDIPVYTAIPGAALETGEDINGYVSEMLSSGGLDFAVSADYALLPVLNVGARIKGLPLFPARMKYRTRVIGEYTVEMDPLLADSDALESGDFVTTTNEYDFYHDEKNLQVFRPFKMGVTALYKPFRNNFMTLHPNLDLVIYNGVYVDAGVKLQTSLANILIFKLSSNIEDMIWKQQAGIILNARILELEVAAGFQSADFIKSFQGAGLNFMLGIRAGL